MAFFVLRCLGLHKRRLKWLGTGIIWRLFIHTVGAWTVMIWRQKSAEIFDWSAFPWSFHVTWASLQHSSLSIVELLTCGSGLQELVSQWIRRNCMAFCNLALVVRIDSGLKYSCAFPDFRRGDIDLVSWCEGYQKIYGQVLKPLYQICWCPI